MKRKLTDHKGSLANDALEVLAVDEPGAGGAHHEYLIDLKGGAPQRGGYAFRLSFQNGPVAEAGINGITEEALLAILLDRLRSFQSGPYPCRENALALTNIELGLIWLQQRTRNRQARGVEGKSQK